MDNLENDEEYYSPVVSPSIDYEGSDFEFRNISGQTRIEYAVRIYVLFFRNYCDWLGSAHFLLGLKATKKELYIAASFLIVGIIIMGLVIALLELVRSHTEVNVFYRKLFLPLLLFSWISAFSFTLLFVLPVRKVNVKLMS
jgi:hypothetical protein